MKRSQINWSLIGLGLVAGYAIISLVLGNGQQELFYHQLEIEAHADALVDSLTAIAKSFR